MYGAAGAPPATVKKRNKKLARLLAQDSTDEEMDIPSTSATPSPDSDTNKPWLREFKLYIDGVDEVPNGMSITKWWGVRLIHKYLNYFCADILPEINSSRFPVWASLAKDYLSIMGSSVSSERAFSSAGITISKRRNRLKGDIVEALQFIKCLLQKELIYREPQPSSILEGELLGVTEDDGDPDWVDDDPVGWKKLFIDVETDNED